MQVIKTNYEICSNKTLTIKRFLIVLETKPAFYKRVLIVPKSSLIYLLLRIVRTSLRCSSNKISKFTLSTTNNSSTSASHWTHLIILLLLEVSNRNKFSRLIHWKNATLLDPRIIRSTLSDSFWPNKITIRRFCGKPPWWSKIFPLSSTRLRWWPSSTRNSKIFTTTFICPKIWRRNNVLVLPSSTWCILSTFWISTSNLTV